MRYRETNRGNDARALESRGLRWYCSLLACWPITQPGYRWSTVALASRRDRYPLWERLPSPGEEVTTSGHMVRRHPFYVGNLFIDAGIVVMAWGSPDVLFPVGWFAVYIASCVTRRVMIRPFGQAYKDIWRVIPRLIQRASIAARSADSPGGSTFLERSAPALRSCRTLPFPSRIRNRYAAVSSLLRSDSLIGVSVLMLVLGKDWRGM